eukprot:COSAG02_NODE_190_length_30025_cov_22.989875_9_plen_495_part_00
MSSEDDDAGFASAEEETTQLLATAPQPQPEPQPQCQPQTADEPKRSATGVALRFGVDQRAAPSAVVLPAVPSTKPPTLPAGALPAVPSAANVAGLPSVPSATSPRGRSTGAAAVDAAANVAAREVGNFLTGLTTLLDGSSTTQLRGTSATAQLAPLAQVAQQAASALSGGLERATSTGSTGAAERTSLERDLAQVRAQVQAGLPQARAQVEAALPQALQAAQQLAPIAADAAAKLGPVLAAAQSARGSGGSKFAGAVAAVMAAQQLVQQPSAESGDQSQVSEQTAQLFQSILGAADRVAGPGTSTASSSAAVPTLASVVMPMVAAAAANSGTPAAHNAASTAAVDGSARHVATNDVDDPTPATTPIGVADVVAAPVQAMLASPTEKQQLIMALQSPPILQMALATPQIREFIAPLLSDDTAVTALLADPEITILLSEGAPARDVLLSDPDIGPVLRRASGRGGREAVLAQDGDDILDAALEASEMYTPAPPKRR